MSATSLIAPYFRENRGKIAAGMLSLLAVDILQLLIPRVLKSAVDDLTRLDATAAGLAFYALAITGIAAGIGVLRYIWRLCLLGSSRRVEEALRERLFAHLQLLPAAYFDRTRTGDLMAHATNDIQQIRMAAGMGLVALNDAVVMGLMAVGFMVAIDPKLAAVALAPMPLIAVAARYFSRRLHHRYRAVQASFAELTETIRERFAGIRLIQAHHREADEARRVEASSRAYVRENLALIRTTGSFFPLMVLLTNLSLALVLLFGGRQAIRLEITPGDFVAFISYLGLLTWPMMALGWVTNLIQRGRASIERVQAILDTVPEIRDAPGAEQVGAVRGEIVFEGVGFRYRGLEGATAALEGIDLTVPAGAVLGIVGPPGSGKTTLLSLVPRLYDPSAGVVRLDGRDVRRLRLAELRAAIAYMPQEPFLFAGTVGENIALGDPSAGRERMEAAARDAALLDTLRAFPEGFDTVVGERGITLSGGQKQRVTLARCLLTEAPILILDDPVSQVDFETAGVIIQTLRRLAGRRTILIASHRIAALSFADRIAVLEAGRIAAVGTHAELLEASAYYARAYRLQEIEEEAVHAA